SRDGPAHQRLDRRARHQHGSEHAHLLQRRGRGERQRRRAQSDRVGAAPPDARRRAARSPPRQRRRRLSLRHPPAGRERDRLLRRLRFSRFPSGRAGFGPLALARPRRRAYRHPPEARPTGGDMATTSAGVHEPHGVHQTKKATASGWIGSALEYYDFFIYATAASLIFPQIFFPKGDPTVAIVASLATYGVGYVARPIGAFVLGHWGDTHGRKNVLILCMVLMGVSTMGVGLLPTYAQAGVLAPALLVILRLIQGFAVAGEISGASSMILEHAPFGRRGFFASFTLQGV